jgi:UDP-GlcNAc:undecaprenyl-phosphate GlcNAc-1-phosphate transferase
MYAFGVYLLIFLTTLLLSWVLTPLLGKLATRVGCVDRPGGRKIHARNIPYFGGVAVFLSFAGVLVALYWFFPEFRREGGKVTAGLLLGGTLILVTGLVDDFRSTPPGLKLAGQAAAALILAGCGLRIGFLTNPMGGEIEFGVVVGTLLTLVWVVSMVNAMNLIDGLDGLAGGVALIGSVALFAVALNRGDRVDMVLTALLAGSTLGFLRYNFFPARIFLGDAGSMFLGFTLAVIGLEGIQKGATVVAFMIPLSALAIPVLDTLMAIARRSKVSGSIFKADHEHLHHRLVRLGIRKQNVVLLIYFFCIHLGTMAFILTLIPSEYTLMILVLIAMGIIFWIKTLGFIEEKMALRLRQSEQESMIDETTGLCSFQYLSRRVIEEIKTCDRLSSRSFSLLVFELKGLRSYLERFPNPREMEARFRDMARFFQENIRASDVVSYLGEESFVIMTPEEGEGRQYLIDRLRTIFQNMKADLDTEAIELKIRQVDYPGNKGIVQELLRDAVEVA